MIVTGRPLVAVAVGVYVVPTSAPTGTVEVKATVWNALAMSAVVVSTVSIT